MAYSDDSAVSFTAPFFVGCLFPPDDDQRELEEQQRHALSAFTAPSTPTSSLSPVPPSPSPPPSSDYHSALLYETIRYQFLDRSLLLRQFDDHPTNANALWPEATFLAEFLTSSPSPSPSPCLRHLHAQLGGGRRVLELGSATGALAIYLRLHGIDVTSSDLNDPLVTANVAHNCALNGVGTRHLVHTWGDLAGLKSGVDQHGGLWDVLLASDVLAYEAAYEALVETVCALMPAEGEAGAGQDDGARRFGGRVLWMCWKRREQKSRQRENGWFGLMRKRGFDCTQMGKGIWQVRRSSHTHR